MINGVSELELLEAIGRATPLFLADLNSVGEQLKDLVAGQRFLVIGGAGSMVTQSLKR